MPALRRHKVKPPPDEDEDDSSESGKQPLIEKDYSKNKPTTHYIELIEKDYSKF